MDSKMIGAALIATLILGTTAFGITVSENRDMSNYSGKSLQTVENVRSTGLETPVAEKAKTAHGVEI